MRFETIHPKELGPADIVRWRAHQHAQPHLQSPYLTPDWAQTIGAVREDARVCVIDNGAGYFGAQRLSRFSAMGLGAPISDYQGIVGDAELAVDSAALCRALKVGRIDLTHVPADQKLFGDAPAGAEGSWFAEVAGGRELYEAALKLKRAEFIRQTDKKARKLTRERGALEFRAQSDDSADFETLIAWKNAQLARTGQPEIWATPWVRHVLDSCWQTRGNTQFGGMLFTMRLEGRLAAAAFGLRSGRVLHLWLIAHDSEFDAYSPGVQLARWALGWAGDQAVAEVDFGPGDYQYKRQLSTTQRMLEHGVLAGASVSGAVRRAAYALRTGVERLPQPALAALPGKAMRRHDLIRALAA